MSPPDNALEGGWTHTHLLGRDLYPLEVSEDILAGCL